MQQDAMGIEAERIKARVLWYSFMGAMTQQEIAERLGITRLRVNRIIGQARQDGSVAIDIRVPLASCIELEQRLIKRYELKEATVVPSMADYQQTRRVVGETAGFALDRLLEDGRSIGVGWGTTLSIAIRGLRPRRLQKSWVVALMGGLTRGSGTNTFEVSTELSRALSASCYYLAAPIYCPDEQSRDSLLSHYGLSEVIRLASEVDVALVSCGDLSKRSNLVMTPIVESHLPELHEAGAVGDILGTFIDADGRPVNHPLNRRVLALTPAGLGGIKDAILTAAGTHKHAITRAILQGRFINRLIVDEETALLLL
ncbi:DNA-binding transcriptional regulator LsrR, DeoR family [Arboricoccus pini]|uniref:DNA-binding transcriptional regulator LsrR, DeoR family n=2 Tax=Arboricoccus pini TaxID=1963835 RepID=A0A212R7V1_9PROT|nr:DNA-binding transcriptional regulator LsrR, DeoR family [Arboricoccus pini]